MTVLAFSRGAGFFRGPLMRVAAALSALTLAACQPVGPAVTGPQTGPAIDPKKPVQVALLVPAGTGDAQLDWAARSLTNAGKMAAADAQGARVDLRVYPTGGNAGAAVAAANRAVNEGAQVIVGPLFAESANAVGTAMKGRVNVLSFSNNADIAGGNLFTLGTSFDNIANRLVGYGVRQGKRRFLIVSENDRAGQIGEAAIAAAIARNRGQMVGRTAHGPSAAEMDRAAATIAEAARINRAEAVFMTANTGSVLPEIAAALNRAGLTSDTVQMMGLTRWDLPPERRSLAQLQNGWFAVPDLARNAAFQQRYQAAYGERPHELASLAYDGVSAIAALARAGRKDAVQTSGLTSGAGFAGIGGPFRLRGDGTSERALGVATIRGGQVVILDAAPRGFGGAGF